MSVPHPTTPQRRTSALEPQRKHGKARVAALLRAAVDVIAERGFEAATMAEIAGRAGAPIGSLYRFFPNKDVLADALIRRYVERIDEAFSQLDSRREASDAKAFADALLGVLAELRGPTQSAMVALLDARADGAAWRGEFHDAYHRNLVAALQRREPRLATREAEDMAVVLVQNMKAMKSLSPERDAGAIEELRTMTRLYLENKLDARAG